MQRLLLALGVALAAPLAIAQKYEFAVAGGGSFHNSKDVSGPRGSASAGFENGWAASAGVGHDMYTHLGGEIRYMFQQHDMKVSSGGTKATFGAQSHIIHYDLVIHGAPRGAKMRPYVAGGGGAKIYRGTGAERAFQPLSNVAILTKTQETTGLVSVGGGVKFELSANVHLRVDVHDYLTPFPKKVITPATGASVSGWLNNIVPTVGISFTF
ncbi:MAG: outer membrane beta-barrel protein [Acidobacteria bacterium]|nr:outer membrane beta-barrel protein [Acidobacteriota bacterium]MBI3278389.1 outer membrane beta-barrel protein [Acidobacteriota bacterium]